MFRTKELFSLLDDDSSRIIAITPGEKGEIESFLNGDDQQNAKAASLAWKNLRSRQFLFGCSAPRENEANHSATVVFVAGDKHSDNSYV